MLLVSQHMVQSRHSPSCLYATQEWSPFVVTDDVCIPSLTASLVGDPLSTIFPDSLMDRLEGILP